MFPVVDIINHNTLRCWCIEQKLKATTLICVSVRAIGTFSRALDSTSAVRQPSLHMSAAAASRDITLVCHGGLFTSILLSFVVFLEFWHSSSGDVARLGLDVGV